MKTSTIRNILFLNRGSVLYGAETRMLDIIQQLDRGAFKPFVMLPSPGPLSDILHEIGVEVIFCDFALKANPSLTSIIKLNQEMFKVLKKYNIHILHFNMHFGISNLWPIMLFWHRRTVVHLRSHFWIYPLEKFLIYRCAKIITVSNYIKNDFLKPRRSDLCVFKQPHKVETVYDGIDIKTFKPMTVTEGLRKEYNINANEKIVAVVGALHPVKGQNIVIESAPMVLKEHPLTKILLIGGSYLNNGISLDYKNNLVKRIKELGLEQSIILTGPRKHMPQIMNEIDILLQPSEHEALGTSMVEAMACQKPVIGSAVDGIPEVIGDDIAGYLLKERSPQELARLISLLLSNSTIALEKSQSGLKRVQDYFNIYKTIKDLENIYNVIK